MGQPAWPYLRNDLTLPSRHHGHAEKGHMDQFMKGKRNTKTIDPPPTTDNDLETSDDLYPATEPDHRTPSSVLSR